MFQASAIHDVKSANAEDIAVSKKTVEGKLVTGEQRSDGPNRVTVVRA